MNTYTYTYIYSYSYIHYYIPTYVCIWWRCDYSGDNGRGGLKERTWMLSERLSRRRCGRRPLLGNKSWTLARGGDPWLTIYPLRYLWSLCWRTLPHETSPPAPILCHQHQFFHSTLRPLHYAVTPPGPLAASASFTFNASLIDTKPREEEEKSAHIWPTQFYWSLGKCFLVS